MTLFAELSLLRLNGGRISLFLVAILLNYIPLYVYASVKILILHWHPS